MTGPGPSTMHVAIDAHVFDPRGRGMSHYAERYLAELAAAPPGDMRFTVLARFPDRLPRAPHLEYVRVPDVPAPAWEQVLLPAHVWRLRPRLLHALANTLPVIRAGRVPTVLSLHDVMFMHPDPEISAGNTLVQKVGVVYRTWVTRLTVPRCDQVITISEYSRAEIEGRFPAQRGRVKVVYLGPSFEPRPGGASPAPAGAPYVLVPGGNHARKNVRRAIEAFLRFRAETGAPWHLRVFGVGEHQLDLAPFTALPGGADVRAVVHLLGYVPEPELPGLFQGAEVVFFPSLCEGFGIPVLDALVFGKPVVTSNVTSLPEVAGEAGLCVDPRSIDDMAAALRRLHDDPALRARLAAHAAEQADRFRWEQVTARTLDLYRALVRAGPSPRRAR